MKPVYCWQWSVTVSHCLLHQSVHCYCVKLLLNLLGFSNYHSSSFTFKYTCTIDWPVCFQTLYFSARPWVYMCALYMYKLTAYMFGRPLSWAEKLGGGGGEEGAPCSNCRALIPVYLSPYKIHRGGSRWHMQRVNRKPVTVCRVTGKRHSYGCVK